MKQFLFFILFSTFIHNNVSANGPIDITERSMVDTSLVPFYHGVASTDPTSSAVIIWTRVTPEIEGAVNGTWRVALDTNFTSIIKSGNFTADSTSDYCVSIDVTGLQPNTWYFYEFTALGRNSLTGRTKTAPIGGVSQLRFAFVSCANYKNGYYNVYNRLKDRNDIDAILHLGDYIYEYSNSLAVRPGQLPDHEIVQLADYRQRYSSHRLDPALMRLHQQFPFITVWDDHEVANNSYSTGADNHQPATEGPWAIRKSAGEQANNEWLPKRLTYGNDITRIWRKFNFGNLAELFMLDTRLFARSKQGGNPNDTSRHLLGDEQFEWLKQELLNSTAKWKILGQQVMMGNLTPFGIMLNDDQWDGYNAERKKLYDFILNNNIKNVIVLTGDIHTAWAMDLPYNTSTYNPNTGAGSVGVEFVCSSVTSASSPIPLDPLYPIISAVLPHIKYVDLYKKGYGILDLKENVAQGDFYSVATITKLDTTQHYETGYYTLDGTRWLKKASSPTILLQAPHYYAPENPRTELTTGIKTKSTDLIVLSAYPNPFIDRILIQFNTAINSNVQLNVYDLSGRLVKQNNLGYLTKGLYNKTIYLNNLASGLYKIILTNNNDIIERTIEKF
ncbi:MAG: alkaline phosphatase D family protein [Chitinophagales bacterium]